GGHARGGIVHPTRRRQRDRYLDAAPQIRLHAVEELAGALDIGLVDMDFVAPDSFLAGPQVWRVQNNGLQVHHLVLACVPDGAPEDQVMELAAVFMGGPPAPRSCGRSTPRRRWICSSRCSSRRDSSTSMSSISRPAPT